MNLRVQWLVFLLACAIPITSSACEPIIPLTQLLSGASAAGSLLIGKSLLLLAAAVTLKSCSFAWLERRFTWRKAVWFMLLANVVSTIPGVLIATLAGSIAAWFLSLPIVFLMGTLVGQRLRLLEKPKTDPQFLGFLVAVIFTGIFILSVLLHERAGDVLGDRRHAAYWTVKLAFVALVATTGIVISAVLEETVIARCAKATHVGQSFYTSVVRANYITLGVILLVAASQMLPQRLHSPHFIVSWLRHLTAMPGLAWQ